MRRKPIAPRTFPAAVLLFGELDAASIDRLAAGAERQELKGGAKRFRKGDAATDALVPRVPADVVLAEIERNPRIARRTIAGLSTRIEALARAIARFRMIGEATAASHACVRGGRAAASRPPRFAFRQQRFAQE